MYTTLKLFNTKRHVEVKLVNLIRPTLKSYETVVDSDSRSRY